LGALETQRKCKKFAMLFYIYGFKEELVAASDGVWAAAFGAGKIHLGGGQAVNGVAAGLAGKLSWSGVYDELGTVGGRALAQLRHVEAEAFWVNAGKRACKDIETRDPGIRRWQGSDGCVEECLGDWCFVHGVPVSLAAARSNAPVGTRTQNPQLRRLMLYPIELQALKDGHYTWGVAEGNQKKTTPM
jgi:hypothetical protein